MKIFLPAVTISLLALLSSCGNNGDKTPADSMKKDSVTTTQVPFLEDLLKIKDEKELIAQFGAGNVKTDTMWGPEGDFGFATYVNKGTPDELQITWKDSATRSGIEGISVYAYFGNDKRSFGSKWRSKTGIHLGMSTDSLAILNGHSFMFSGVGWDYGGGITDWEKGKFEGIKLGIQLDADYDAQPNDKDIENVSGDQDVSSENPSVKAVAMKVVAISVYP
ncbi:MAG TPA: hypothetical protein VL651_07120 [Bacteroidia bacterium]|jgi:hypothetical protein|nr:hypothetical protein [Bacteroidia bacterium]